MAVQIKDNNYRQSWGGINLFNSKDNGASVKSLYQNLQNLQKRTQKLQRPQIEVIPQHTEQNSSTNVKTFYAPIYRKNRLINTGGTSKQEVSEGFDTSHKININKVRADAEKNLLQYLEVKYWLKKLGMKLNLNIVVSIKYLLLYNLIGHQIIIQKIRS